VKQYKYDELYLIGTRNKVTGEYLKDYQVDDIAVSPNKLKIYLASLILGLLVPFSVVYGLGTALSVFNDLDVSSFGLAGRLSIGYQFISIYGGS
jgi:hypothetical protein